MNAPAGVVMAARTPWFDLTECSGHRTVRWEDGVRVGEEPDLDAPVRGYLPGCFDGITVRDLLLHRGGLWEWYPLYIHPEQPPPRSVTVLGHPGYVGGAVGFVPDRDIALVVVSNRLLVDGAPVPTDVLWHDLLKVTAQRSRTA